MVVVTSVRAVALVLNSGSSSLKFALFDLGSSASAALTTDEVDAGDYETAFSMIERRLAATQASSPAAIGHRIVHGGPDLVRHGLIDADVQRKLERAEPLAPLHIPAACALLKTSIARYPDAAQVACFDTAFHAGMPDIARTLPIPRRWRDAGVHRYGFHGLSCESVLHQLGGRRPERIVIAHLGSGASVTAVLGGRSVDTSMGLTPTGGVIMAARCGDIDPGVLIHLMRTQGCTATQLEQLLNRQSGLMGISDVSGDMRILHGAPAASDAELAVRMFCRSVSKQIAAMMTSLGGADLIVFTGGIGEHDERVRAAVCADLAWANVAITPNAPGSCAVITLPAREEEQIARHMRDLLAAARYGSGK